MQKSTRSSTGRNVKPKNHTLSREQWLDQARLSLLDIWRRWNKEADAAERERLWVWVVEAEARLLQAKRANGMLVENVCPECSATDLFVFQDETQRDRSICKKCGWADSNDFRAIIKKTASRIKKLK